MCFLLFTWYSGQLAVKNDTSDIARLRQLFDCPRSAVSLFSNDILSRRQNNSFQRSSYTMNDVIDAPRLQLLASQDQSSDTTDVTRPPSQRAKIAQRWRLDV
jgi:hypothetical protein